MPATASKSSKKSGARTLRHLMAAADIFEKAELGRKAGVSASRITLMGQGWRGTPELRDRVAKALGVTVDTLKAAIVAAIDEV